MPATDVTKIYKVRIEVKATWITTCFFHSHSLEKVAKNHGTKANCFKNIVTDILWVSYLQVENKSSYFIVFIHFQTLM